MNTLLPFFTTQGEIDHYPSGEPWLELEYAKEEGFNRYLFGGKERTNITISICQI